MHIPLPSQFIPGSEHSSCGSVPAVALVHTPVPQDLQGPAHGKLQQMPSGIGQLLLKQSPGPWHGWPAESLHTPPMHWPLVQGVPSISFPGVQASQAQPLTLHCPGSGQSSGTLHATQAPVALHTVPPPAQICPGSRGAVPHVPWGPHVGMMQSVALASGQVAAMRHSTQSLALQKLPPMVHMVPVNSW
jgi:hypothetical protein